MVLGQSDTIFLKQVDISDNPLKKYSNTTSVSTLNDSVIAKNKSSLTALLNNNSTLYFKENGLGMVSSPSFRGTTAQQTAVIWNGININSQLNGQTDFNTITTSSFNSISIRAGGGSSIYGSSAIGGSIHLNNQLNFKDEFVNNLNLKYGSFNTFNVDYNLKLSSKKVSTQFSFSRNTSKNNYKYLNTESRNENGQFANSSFNFNFGYKLNSKTSLKLYSQFFDGERNFSGTLVAPSKSNYLDVTTRNLLEYSNYNNNYIATVRMAFLSEKYNYFENKNNPEFSFGKSETALLKYDFQYKINSKLNINSIADATQTKAFGSDIKNKTRQIFSGIILVKHQVFSSFLYEFTLRKEITSNYKSPILYSIGTNYKVSKNYLVKLNLSRNFRVPTFNDLYWNPGGNENLLPESAFQYDFQQQLTIKNLRFSVSSFLNKITDMISWKPNETGIWQPINTNKVTTYGLETNLNFNKKIALNHFVKFNLNYGYTVSKNEITKKQLIYVPYHKFTSSLSYAYKKIDFYCTYLFSGKVFTSLDNEYKLKEYTVVNSGLEYQLFKTCKLGFSVQNLFNENYQVVAQRPFPGRNFTFNFNLKL